MTSPHLSSTHLPVRDSSATQDSPSRKTSPHSFRRNLAAGFQDLQCPLLAPFTGIGYGMPVLGPVHLSVVAVILRCKIECARINGPCPITLSIGGFAQSSRIDGFSCS